MSNSEQLAQPSKVATAVRVLYATLGIGIIRSILESSRHAEASSIGFVLFITFFVFGLMWFLIYMIGKGRNWARITFLVLFILGVPLSILPMIQSLTHEPISGVLGLVQIVMQVTALVFLFQGGSSVWFKAMKKLKSENTQQGAPGDAPKVARP
jgi:FtsH-binding integral membrane protein